MLDTVVLGSAAAIGLVAGTLIGTVGVGGIIVVPSLLEFQDAEARLGVKGIIASAMFSYIFVGIAGGYAYWKKSDFVVWGSAAWMCLGALPGGFLGALVLEYISGIVIKLVLYALVLGSSLFALLRTWQEAQKKAKQQLFAALAKGGVAEAAEDVDALGGRTTSYTAAIATGGDGADADAGVGVGVGVGVGTDAEDAAEEKPWETRKGRGLRVVIGMFAGFASALTGTSGPVVLLPILFCFGWQIHDAAGSAQMIQFPIAVAATISGQFLSSEDIDYALGACIAAGIVPGAFMGAAIAFKLKAETLKTLVATILVLASIFLVGKLIYQELKDEDSSAGNSTGASGGSGDYSGGASDRYF